ncbi:hypothetical protein [Vibrio phage vB_pir03]|nr:hypothetical protein [Vibrio phage vB_pir03]
MSYGYRGGRRGGGGGGFQPKPRPQLAREHELHPLIEAACKHENKAALRDFGTRGTEVSKETIVLDGDPSRTPLPIPVAAMYNTMQFGIHHTHPEFPRLEKFDTNYESNFYHAKYSSPIMWIHNSEETDFRHIPTYTRYVIDKHRRVLNAYNGMEVKPANKFMIELVPDGPANRLSKVSIDFLMFMAFSALPDDFVDYGFRTYSHDFGMDLEGRQYGLVKKGKVKVKNNEVNMVAEYDNLPEFMKRCLAPKEFQVMKEINEQSRDGFRGAVISAGPFSIRESIAYVPPAAIPSVNSGQSQAPAQQSQQQTDEFNTAPQQQQQPQQQAPQQSPMQDDINFDEIEF